MDIFIKLDEFIGYMMEGQKKFYKSVKEQYEKTKYISDKQKSILEKIYEQNKSFYDDYAHEFIDY